jgi:hypothetical protein
VEIKFQQAKETLSACPAATSTRSISGCVYDAKDRLFVIFNWSSVVVLSFFHFSIVECHGRNHESPMSADFS